VQQLELPSLIRELASELKLQQIQNSPLLSDLTLA